MIKHKVDSIKELKKKSKTMEQLQAENISLQSAVDDLLVSNLDLTQKLQEQSEIIDGLLVSSLGGGANV